MDLKLVKRRQEKIGFIGRAELYDDFAHHPTAIDKTLVTLKNKFPEIYAIFEPASSTARSDLFQNRFVDAFKLATGARYYPTSSTQHCNKWWGFKY